MTNKSTETKTDPVEMTNSMIEEIRESIIQLMHWHIGLWENSDFYLVLGVRESLGYIDINHNTTCYGQCCLNKTVTLISLCNFNLYEWAEYDEEDEEWVPNGTVEEWTDIELFSFERVREWLLKGYEENPECEEELL